ncbi:hypothetical protein TRFO_31053 [Tritrichomonas foetus]|uniref:Uncharacterized protein n=1 Tax=Tritrichomonas foetus TaxID=1144522 RepID=A0A1J4JU28_9EUKA|nr:hypothetical protein TRFO_31053 [Tritrichomonas foetus]|eukprot:OHT01976.1 hypothetical protein TRFO_31053 [Tritrichomonas foetus]
MSEVNFSSSITSSSSLKEHLSNLQAISHNEGDNSVVTKFESKIKENLNLKEDLINLQSQLKISQESTRLQEAEYAFQLSEYEAEVQSLRKIEAELRSALAKLSRESDDKVHDIELKFKKELDAHEKEKNDYINSIQSQVSRLRSHLSEYQVQNEIMADDLHKLKQENTDLRNQIDEQKALYENKVQLLENRVKSSESSMTEFSGIMRTNKNKLENQISNLQSQLLTAQRKIADLQSEKQVFDDREDTLNKQIQSLVNEHNLMAEKIAAENAKIGQLKTVNSRLQNRVDLVETENKTLQRLLAQIKDNTKESRSVSFCSPLQRTRIDILKIIENNNKKMTDLAFQLFPEYWTKEIRFRSLVLFVIFAARWRKNTRNDENICDHKGGLSIFAPISEQTSLQLIVRAKNELATSNCLTNDIKVKSNVAEHQITELVDQNKRSNQMQEALALQLRSAKKCNNTLHRQLKSFIKFHDAVFDYEIQ